MTEKPEILQRKRDTPYETQEFKVKHTEQYDQKNTINNERDHIGLQTTRVTEYIMSEFRWLGNMQLHADQKDTTGYHSISLHNSGCKELILTPLELFYQNDQEIQCLLLTAIITITLTLKDPCFLEVYFSEKWSLSYQIFIQMKI